MSAVPAEYSPNFQGSSSMSQGSIPSDWLNRFTDPYAVLGISVTADDRRVLKRYRNVARILHPDSQIHQDEATKQLATQLFAKLVNPAYEQLKQEKNRRETSALLRLRVRHQVTRNGSLNAKSERAGRLIKYPATEVDIFYEQAIEELANLQYESLNQFAAITQELGELNLVYLQLKMGEVSISREKRTGLIPTPEAQPVQFPRARPDHEVVTESYDRRHYKRAQEYAKKENWDQVVQELKDALKIDAKQGEYYSLLGVAYLKKNLPGMAKTYIGQALKLNPQDPIALKFAAKVGVPVPAETNQQPNQDNGHRNGKPSDRKQSGGKPAAPPQGFRGLFQRLYSFWLKLVGRSPQKQSTKPKSTRKRTSAESLRSRK